jgi:DNA-binding CsgD family transcriptional regulator
MPSLSAEKVDTSARNSYKLIGELLDAFRPGPPASNEGFRVAEILGSGEGKTVEAALKPLAELLKAADLEGFRQTLSRLGPKAGLSHDRALLAVLGIQNLCLYRLFRSGLGGAQIVNCAGLVQQLFDETLQRVRAVYGHANDRATDQPPVRPADRINPLTAREREIVSLLMQGLRTREIAAVLTISTKTVEAHRSHAMTKLKVRNVAQLIYSALQLGLQPAPFEKERLGMLK